MGHIGRMGRMGQTERHELTCRRVLYVLSRRRKNSPQDTEDITRRSRNWNDAQLGRGGSPRPPIVRVRPCSSVSVRVRPCPSVFVRVSPCSSVSVRVSPSSSVFVRVRPCETERAGAETRPYMVRTKSCHFCARYSFIRVHSWFSVFPLRASASSVVSVRQLTALRYSTPISLNFASISSSLITPVVRDTSFPSASKKIRQGMPCTPYRLARNCCLFTCT